MLAFGFFTVLKSIENRLLVNFSSILNFKNKNFHGNISFIETINYKSQNATIR